MASTFKPLLSLFVTSTLLGQVGPFPTDSVSLVPVNQQSVRIPASSPSTLPNITIDAPPAGQETLDILVEDPNVIISLIVPGGGEITAANASGSGYTFTTYTTDGGGTSADLFSPFMTAGTHTMIQFPVPAQTGVYSVKANATSAQADTAMTVQYYASSSVSLGAVKATVSKL